MTENDKKQTLATDTGRKVEINQKTTLREKKKIKEVENKPPKALDLEEEQKEIKAEQKKAIIDPVVFDESGDFASMLLDMEISAPEKSIQVGDKVSGKIVFIGDENAFIALGPKTEGVISKSELKDHELGDIISAYVLSTTDGIMLSNSTAHRGFDLTFLEEALSKKIPIEGKVIALNKGGFEVEVNQKRAFCPISQIDDRFVADPNAFLGRTFTFLIEKIENKGQNIVLSRRAYLDRKNNELALELLKNLEAGDTLEGSITKFADFGAFVDLGGIEGLVPKGEITFGHIEKASDVLAIGQRVKALVLRVEKNEENPKKSRISLSIKKTMDDPYTLYFDRVAEGATLEGKVVRLENYGAFVELFPGIDGLVHIGEISSERIHHPKDVLTLDQPVTVKVLSVDRENKRISLSLREETYKNKDLDLSSLKLGLKVTGVISRIERYGVFLTLKNGINGLIPHSETGCQPHSDLNKAFALGDALDAMIIDIDPQNRVKLSILALKQKEERDSFSQFQSLENAKSMGFGKLADLLKRSTK